MGLYRIATMKMLTHIFQEAPGPYITTFKEVFLQNGIATLQNLNSQGWVAGLDTNIFVSNHDTDGYAPLLFLHQWVLISPGIELQLPQCILTLKHLHIGYHLLPVYSSSALYLFRNTFLMIDFLFVLSTFAQHSSLWHTFCTTKLHQFLQCRCWRTKWWFGLCIFPSSHLHKHVIAEMETCSDTGNVIRW